MPRYDFECRKCDMVFELGCTLEQRQAHEEGVDEIKCPVCEKETLHQVLSPIRFAVN